MSFEFAKPRTIEIISPMPEIDSIWLAKDGRRVQVYEIVKTIYIKGGWWAKLFVFPPYSHRQRRKTTANAEAFTSGFYTLESL